MPKISLKKYLHSKLVELYETVNELKDQMLNDDFTNRESILLEVNEAKLNLIKEIIEICNNRNRY